MPKVLKTIWDEFVYGGHLLSIGAAGIVFASAKLLGINISIGILVVSYCFSQAIYLYNRLEEYEIDKESNLARSKHLSNSIHYLSYFIVAYLVLAYAIMLYENKYDAIAFSFIPLTIGWLYSKLLKNLTKNIPGFKTFIVSLDWAMLLPLLYFYYNTTISLTSFVLIFLLIFIRWVINTSFFDIKDIQTDSKLGLKTLPILLGLTNFKVLLHILNLISLVPVAIGISIGALPMFSISLLLLIPFAWVFIHYVSSNTRPSWIFYIYADSEFIIWALLILAGSRYI